jgi:biopolymer transport protein ExbD
MTSEKDIKKLLHQRRLARRRSNNVFTLNLAPMMDVMFNLLVFFLVATAFTLPEGLLAAKLPRTTGISASASLAVPVVPIKIFLEPADMKAGTRIRVSTSLRSDAATLTVVQNFEDLYSLLAQMVIKPGITADTPVIIAAKPQTSWDQVVNAFNACLRAKCKNVVFASWK